MPRRLLALLFVSLALLAVVAAGPILFPPTNPRITPENFERIKEGMTWEEVVGILGPPGDYRTEPTHFSYKSGRVLADLDDVDIHWQSDRADILVCIDADGVLTLAWFLPMEPDLDWLIDKLWWRWGRWRESRR
jgi:hypothetical protein